MFIEVAFKVMLILGYSGLVVIEVTHISGDRPSLRHEQHTDESDKNL